MTSDIKQFRNTVDSAFASPKNFNSIVLEELKENTDSKLKELIIFFDSGNVIYNKILSDFFLENQDEIFVNFLADAISVDKPKQFIEILSILGKMRNTRAIDKIASSLSSGSPESEELIMHAVRYLADFAKQNKKALDALVNFYFTHNNETKLSASIKYLLPIKLELIPIFLSKYRSLKNEKKIWALKYLAETGDPLTLRLFDEELTASPLEKGFLCIRGLGKIKSDEAVKILEKQCKNKEWFIRKKIAEALGQTENHNAVRPLLSMLDDISFQVQAAVIDGISKVGNLMPELIIDSIKNLKKESKINLVRAIGQLKNEAFVEPLIDVLNDCSTLFFSIDALGDLGFKSAISPLKKILNDKVWFNRLNALEALWKLEAEDIGQIAQKATQDENDMVRNTASRILSSINFQS